MFGGPLRIKRFSATDFKVVSVCVCVCVCVCVYACQFYLSRTVPKIPLTTRHCAVTRNW